MDHRHCHSPSVHRLAHARRRQGFTLIELLVVMGIIALLLSILLPALSSTKRRSVMLKDATKLRQIHTAWLTWSRSFEGRFPTPGLIDRVGSQPGEGAEDLSKNSHANLYSACIAANYFSPQMTVCEAESSANVAVLSTYDFNAYKPNLGVYWDSAYKADLATTSNLSYATLHLDGPRKSREWRESLNSRFAVLANRGVRDGLYDDAVYATSKTLAIHGDRRSWDGNVCFNDNHIAIASAFTLEGPAKLGANQDVSDNLFRADPEGNGQDIWLTMISSVSTSGSATTFQLSWD